MFSAVCVGLQGLSALRFHGNGELVMTAGLFSNTSANVVARAIFCIATASFLLIPDGTAQALGDVADLDHAGIIEDWDDEAFARGQQFFESSCATCHGASGLTPTHPRARAFGKEPFKYGDDPYSMYRTLTHGAGTMLPQTWLAPAERYDVIYYIRESILRNSDTVERSRITREYLASLPKGTHSGTRSKSNPRDFGPVLMSQVERRVNLALTFSLGYGVSMSYDLQRMSVSDVWRGALDLSQTQHVRLRGERQPIPDGEAIVGLADWYWCVAEGFQPPPSTRHETWIDGSESSAWLPKDLMQFHGHYVYGRNAALSYAIKGRDVLEMPGAMESDGLPILHHTLRIEPGGQALTLCVGQYSAGNWPMDGVFSLFEAEPSSGEHAAAGTFALAGGESSEGDYGEFVAAAVVGETDALRWTIDDLQRILLEIPAASEPIRLRVYRCAGTGRGHIESFVRVTSRAQENGQISVPDLALVKDGGPRLWRETYRAPITLDDADVHYDPADYGEDDRALVSRAHFPYAVDTVALPEPNAWNAWMRMADLAFYDDGTLAVATLGGDVWLVDGVEVGSEEAVWTRFASGMFEPLGLRVFDGVLHVTTRSGIVRLHDRNGDGQADYYENFHADHEVSNGFHGYNFDLLRDADGYFYYIKPGRFTDYRRPGAVVKVSPDGGDFEIVATGFRVPNGLGRGADGSLFATDNQGSWVPANKINRIREGAFYGVFQTGEKDRDDFERPVLWLPQEFDNSPGNIAVATDERFGPLAGKMIAASFGKGWAYYIMPEEVDGAWQGAAAAFPFQFRAGLMRVAVNPLDGQLYFTGLTGWDTESTSHHGCVQRIRYTGGDGTVLVNSSTTADGVTLTFSGKLDPGSVSESANYEIERWNYKRTPRYGSAHWSIESPDRKGHDDVAVDSASLSDDGKSVRLQLSSMVPAETLRIRYRLFSGDRTPVSDSVYLTVHRVPTQ